MSRVRIACFCIPGDSFKVQNVNENYLPTLVIFCPILIKVGSIIKILLMDNEEFLNIGQCLGPSSRCDHTL